MKSHILLFGILLILPFAGSAQRISKCTAPKAKIVMIQDGKEQALTSMDYGKPHTIKVMLEGCVQNIDHRIFVTSRHATVESLGNGVYKITPVSRDQVEVIVDVETFEPYMFYEMKMKGKKKKAKKVMTTYPPEKYMVAFEMYKVL